jgi:hypothetical protein
VTKIKPFDVLAERAFLKIGRGDPAPPRLRRAGWHSFETDTAPIRPFVTAFSGLCQPYLLTAARPGREPLPDLAAAHSE